MFLADAVFDAKEQPPGTRPAVSIRRNLPCPVVSIRLVNMNQWAWAVSSGVICVAAESLLLLAFK